MGNTYQKSGGSAGSKGVDFQINLLSIFLLNALRQNIKDWKLSTENKLANKFDDVVFEFSDGSAILLQAKHKDSKKITLGQLLSTNSKSDDFSLPKYFLSYLEVRFEFPVKSIIICSNTRVHAKILKFLNQNLVGGENMLHYEQGASFYTFNETILPDLIADSKAYYKNNLKDKGMDISLITEENAKEFLKLLQFFFEYPSGNNLEKATGNLLSHLKSSDGLLRNITFRDVYQKVKEWFEQPRGEYLTENRARAMFCEIKSEKYCEWLEDFEVFFKCNDFKITDEKKRIVHVVTERGELLQLMKVYHSFKENEIKALYALADDSVVQELIIKAFELPTYVYLIIVMPKFTNDKLNEMTDKLKDILLCKHYKKVVIVAENNNKFVQRMKLLENDFDVFDKPLTLEDLTEYTQNRLLRKRSIIFQEKVASLNELLPENIPDGFRKSVNSEILQKLIKHKIIPVGKSVTGLNEEVSRYYIERKFERRILSNWGGMERDKKEIFSEEDIFDVEEKTIVISDSAGTGKTTVLTNLATKIKEDHPLLWVVRIELNECTRMLRNTLKYGRSLSIKELLTCTDDTNPPSELEKILFSMNGMMVLMFDGVDEISPDYTELILDLLIQSEDAENVAKVFVTTRQHIASELESRLRVTSFNLTPLTKNDTIDFLTRYWTYNLRSQNEIHQKCEEYATKLISKISFLMFAYDEVKKNEFITFPLYVRMLAEVFLENRGSEEWEGCKEYLSTKHREPKLPDRMNIAELFSMFIEKKRDIFMDKGNPSGNTTANQALLDQFEECLSYHRSLALKLILDKPTYSLFSNRPYDIKDKEIQILKMGIIQKLNNELCFVHRTFAEFFVAESLRYELLVPNKDARFQRFLIEEVFYNEKYNVICHFLDNLLREAVPSISPDIFQNYKSYFGFNDPNLIHRLARQGYTQIIHLVLKCLNYGTSKHAGNILEDLLQQDGIDIRDEMDLTPLHYAVSNNLFDTVKFLVERGADVNTDSESINTTLHLAVASGRIDIVEFLLQSKADVNFIGRNGRTVLHSTIWDNKRDLFELILKYNPDLNIADEDGRTALHLAALVKNFEILKYLAEHTPNINITDRLGCTVLHFAAKGSFCLEIFEFILSHGIDINSLDKAGNTALHYAVEKQDKETVAFLIDRGVDINKANDELNTALHLAALNSSSEMVDILLKRGADANMAGKRGRTALHCVAENECITAFSIVWLLLKHGVDINDRDELGRTALHCALAHKNPDVVEFLIKHGADINATTKEGHTALHVALLWGRWDIIDVLVKHKMNIDAIAKNGDRDIVEFLMKHGVNVNFSKRGDRKTLYLAISDDRWDIVESLVDYKVDIGIADEQGRTALHHAAERGSCEVVEFLIQKGVHIDFKDQEGRTALHVAVYHGRWDVGECLVKYGAEVNVTDNRGHTALHFSVEADESLDFVIFLVEHGINVKVADKEGNTALNLAVSRGKLSIVEFLSTISLDDFFLECHVDEDPADGTLDCIRAE